jgi:hypothetical protein
MYVEGMYNFDHGEFGGPPGSRRIVGSRGGPHPVITTTLAYATATATTRSPALVLAGAATSVLFGLQPHTTGGILAPALSHLTWSLLMLRYLPPLVRLRPGELPSGTPAGPGGNPAAVAAMAHAASSQRARHLTTST